MTVVVLLQVSCDICIFETDDQCSLSLFGFYFARLFLDYIIEYKTVKGKSWTKIITVNGSVYEHCVENIKDKEELVFRISAENAIGVSLPAESQSVRLEKHASKSQHCKNIN